MKSHCISIGDAVSSKKLQNLEKSALFENQNAQKIPIYPLLVAVSPCFRYFLYNYSISNAVE